MTLPMHSQPAAFYQKQQLSATKDTGRTDVIPQKEKRETFASTQTESLHPPDSF